MAGDERPFQEHAVAGREWRVAGGEEAFFPTRYSPTRYLPSTAPIILAAQKRPSCDREATNEANFWTRPAIKEGAKRRKARRPGAVPAKHGSALFRARSPSGAPPRLLSQRPNALTQLRPCFTRTRGRRRYPRRQSRLSQAPGAPVVMPAGTMPKPPGSGVTSPARRNRTCSINRLSPVTPLE